MDFLKSAVASAISKGPPFPYSFGDRVDVSQSVWSLHNGTKREDGSNCSIFSFDAVANKAYVPLARNAVRKLRTLRHPGIIKVLETVETDTYIYIATERITPLEWHIRRKSLTTESIKWGLFTISKALKFINDEATSVHGNVRVSSVFTSESGEWKLGGLDILSSLKEDDAVIYSYGGFVPELSRYAPPEVAKSGWDSIRNNPTHAVDSYNFGTLIYESFNGSFLEASQAGQTKNIPPTMQQSYKRLLNSNPRVRLSVAHFIEQGKRTGGFFETPLIRLAEGIENLGLKDAEERDEFLSELDNAFDDFPEEFTKMKVLPELLKSVEFGGGGARVFAIVMKIGTKLSDDEYESKLNPVIVRLFTSPDRAIRVCLLDNLPLMIDHLSQKIVNDKIFPQMVTGFTDIAPVVREQTVKAVLTVISKLSDRTANGELLRYLAKTANDEQPGIRTNTTVCLGKIAKNLGASTRQKVLLAAFTRSLRDPFIHARNAALLSLAATSDLFSEEECATRLLPAICPSLVDKEKLIRDQANKTMDVFLQRVRKYSATLPDTMLPPPQPSETGNGATPRMATPQTDGSWAGWAVSSFTNTLSSARGNIQDTPSVVSKLQDGRPSSVPPAVEGAQSSISLGASSKLHESVSAQLQRPSSAVEPAAGPSGTQNNGDIFGKEAGSADDDFDAWGDMDDTAFPDASATKSENTKPTATPVAYDDGGEPDFAGWLNAQTKSKSKSTLPKGLTRPSTSTTVRPGGARASTTGSVGSEPGAKRLAAAAPKPKATVTKKIDIKPKEETWGDEDNWGEGWD
ncbi:protein kinase [Xylona heveae TC161]|uniref:Protein kinase n=1 Tax=Xylona heveae (strain CBS 132557 / TC161) TaxID=1328760 RepID=A0A165J2Q8_XYLHT|nr:protein kinase [Xylona heveae TC161]KZF25648.1 protein kinase [Xylona heveae TC161]